MIESSLAIIDERSMAKPPADYTPAITRALADVLAKKPKTDR
jgi:hypothetical protein